MRKRKGIRGLKKKVGKFSLKGGLSRISRRQGVVNHGFVVHGQKLLGHAARDGVEACAAAAGKDDAFHGFLLK